MKKILLMTAMALFTLTSMAGETKDKPKLVDKIPNWVNKNVSYPQDALGNQEEGTVYVAFTVLEGEIQNVEVVGGVSETLDAEVLKTVKSVPMSELGNTVAEDQTYILPVNFAIK